MKPTLAKILIVDDSVVTRNLLRTVVSSDNRLEVIGTAADGLAALKLLDTLRPDLILLDVEMPIMDGLLTLKQIRLNARRIPVIMCSALTQRGAQVTIEALASGAADYVTKPSNQASREAALQQLADELIPKIIALTNTRPNPIFHLAPKPAAAPYHSSVLGHQSLQPQSSTILSQANTHPRLTAPSQPEVVVIGVSTGGPTALDALLPKLPANFPLPILIVQHMPGLFTKMLAERLDSKCPMHVVEATEGDQLKPGVVYIAKGDWHMTLNAYPQSPLAHKTSRVTLRLNQGPLENHCRPAVDPLFRSAVPVYGSRILAVILTGMGSDGLQGCRLIREHGGTVLAQDEQTSAVWGMPAAVAQAGLAHRILPLDQMAAEILRLVSRNQREAVELRESVV